MSTQAVREAAARADALIRQIDEANGRILAANARTSRAKLEDEARQVARAAVTTTHRDMAEATVSRVVDTAVLADLPVAEDGSLDRKRFADVVETAISTERAYLAQVQESAGAGSVWGLGSGHPLMQTVTEADVDRALARAWGRTTRKEA